MGQADDSSGRNAASKGARAPEVRVALSRAATKRFQLRRVRGLLAIELGRDLRLTRGSAGPLGGDLVRIWIDVPRPSRAQIEVRRIGRALARRSLNIKGLTADAGARLVAIVTSEMVRVQARAPKPHLRANGDKNARPAPRRIALSANLGAILTPGQEHFAWMGSGLSFAHYLGNTSQQIYGRWLTRDDAAGRWVEFGVRADIQRTPIAASPWSLSVGAQLGAAHIEATNQSSTWSPTLSGRLGSHYQVSRRASLALSIEPGVAWTMGTEPTRGPKATLGFFATITSLP